MIIIEYIHITKEVYLDYTELFSALGDENRLRILHLLSKKPLCVCEIETLLNLTQSNASRHLSKLRKSGLLITEKEGQWVHYQISPYLLKEGHALYAYLEAVFEELDACKQDLLRYLSYEQQHLTCKDIKEDSQHVKYLLEEKNE